MPEKIRFDLYTDVSVGPKAGWGAVLAEYGTEIARSQGVMKIDTLVTDIFEITAVSLAIDWLVENHLIPQGQIVRVWSDNENAVKWIMGKLPIRKRKETFGKMMAARVKTTNAGRRGGIIIRAQWVKGHQPLGNSAHGDFNKIADRLAREASGVLARQRESSDRRKGRIPQTIAPQTIESAQALD